MLLDYNKIDPELLDALEQLPPLDITRDNVVHIRTALASRPAPTTVEVLEENDLVPSADGDVPVHIFRKTRRANQPALLWIHGGGYVLGKADDERARVIAHDLDCNRCICRVSTGT